MAKFHPMIALRQDVKSAHLSHPLSFRDFNEGLFKEGLLLYAFIYLYYLYNSDFLVMQGNWLTCICRCNPLQSTICNIALIFTLLYVQHHNKI